MRIGSDPLWPILTLAMPQSDPAEPRNVSASRTLPVEMQEASPCAAALCSAIASSSSRQPKT
jgi:hypothetical protein